MKINESAIAMMMRDFDDKFRNLPAEERPACVAAANLLLSAEAGSTARGTFMVLLTIRHTLHNILYCLVGILAVAAVATYRFVS